MNNPEHRVQTTKKLLRDALMSLLAQKPLRSITVKELCLRANLNRGTFYAHYADVYDLLEQIEAEMETDVFAALEPMLSAEGLTPPKVTKKVFECIEANADLCRVTIGPYGDKEFGCSLLLRCKDSIVQCCRRLLPDVGDRKIETYVTFVCGGCLAMMERWLSEGMVESSALLASAAEQIMERGVAFLR